MSTRTARPAFRACHAAIALVVLFGLVVQVAVVVSGGQDANSGDTTAALGLGDRLVNLFSYFTILSNVLVMTTSALLAGRPERDGTPFRVLHLDALLSIVATGVVFAAVLAPIVQVSGWAAVADAVFHQLVPVAFPVVWLLFGPRPRLTWRVVALAFAWPVVWMAYTFVRGAVTGWYPYPFLDAAELGFWPALAGALVVLAGAAALAVVVRLLDARLPVLGGRSALPRATPASTHEGIRPGGGARPRSRRGR
ncbi:Pr6Pr family membrane protein [Quadrisphaera sp. KR29]|uniref:Pr6Pr family membrane protein n=1 Tax=Quadrisphaera sp. KR29 TaxID=3461391 RepID=UPI004044922E